MAGSLALFSLIFHNELVEKVIAAAIIAAVSTIVPIIIRAIGAYISKRVGTK